MPLVEATAGLTRSWQVWGLVSKMFAVGLVFHICRFKTRVYKSKLYNCFKTFYLVFHICRFKTRVYKSKLYNHFKTFYLKMIRTYKHTRQKTTCHIAPFLTCVYVYACLRKIKYLTYTGTNEHQLTHENDNSEN
jgi:hypothetical protein